MGDTLTDSHYDWVNGFCGVDPRTSSQSADMSAAAPNASVAPAANTPSQPADQDTGSPLQSAPGTTDPAVAATPAVVPPNAATAPAQSPSAQAGVLAAAMIAPLAPGVSQPPPSMLDPSIVDAQPWTPIQGSPAAAGDVAATTASTDVAATTATTAASDVAATTAAADATATAATVTEVSTADAIIAGAVGVEESAAVVGVAAAPIPGVDVVVDTGAVVVAAGAALVLGGALLYKALSDDKPPAQAPGPTQSPAPMQDPGPQTPISAPSSPVAGPVQDPGPVDPATAPGADQPGPVQASDSQPRSVRYPVPTCDRITIHGTDEIVEYIYHAPEIPRADWGAAIDDWQRSGELDHGITELETSIAGREDAQQRLGEDSLSELGTPTGATHRQRIEYERALLRAMMRGLGG